MLTNDIPTARGLWWIDSIRVRPRGEFYRYHVTGTNDHNGGIEFSWSVPNLRDGYAFRLRPIEPTPIEAVAEEIARAEASAPPLADVPFSLTPTHERRTPHTNRLF